MRVGRTFPSRSGGAVGRSGLESPLPQPGASAAVSRAESEGGKDGGKELRGPGAGRAGQGAGSSPCSHPASQPPLRSAPAPLSRTFDLAREKPRVPRLSRHCPTSEEPPRCDGLPVPPKTPLTGTIGVLFNAPSRGPWVLCYGARCGLLAHLRAQVCRWRFTEGCGFAADLAAQK